MAPWACVSTGSFHVHAQETSPASPPQKRNPATHKEQRGRRLGKEHDAESAVADAVLRCPRLVSGVHRMEARGTGVCVRVVADEPSPVAIHVHGCLKPLPEVAALVERAVRAGRVDVRAHGSQIGISPIAAIVPIGRTRRLGRSRRGHAGRWRVALRGVVPVAGIGRSALVVGGFVPLVGGRDGPSGPGISADRVPIIAHVAVERVGPVLGRRWPGFTGRLAVVQPVGML